MNSSPGKLYVVATPIGNLNDLSPRAAETLGSVDFIAAEDTRVTAKILNHIGVKKGLVSCQKYNERERAEQIVSRILTGENAAFCSDAGTPVISDPGGTLVSKALDEGITVVPVSGPSAVVSAYVEGKWGVRIENMILVTEDGYRNLTGSERALITLD